MPVVAELGDDHEDRIGLLTHELDVLVLAEPGDLATSLATKLELESGLTPRLELFRERAGKIVAPRLPGILAGIACGCRSSPSGCRDSNGEKRQEPKKRYRR